MNALNDFTKLQDGDLIFIRSHSENAPHIAAITGSNLTHCGIVFREDGAIKVYEGAGRGEYLTIKKWQEKESGPDHSPEPIYVRRLKTAAADLTPESLKRLKAEAAKLHETHYDFAFAWTNQYKDHPGGPPKEYVYCSELQYKAYDRALGVKLGTPHPVKDYFTALPPDQIEKMKNLLNTNEKARKCRGGKDYDPEDLIISPQEVFESELLEDVTN